MKIDALVEAYVGALPISPIAICPGRDGRGARIEAICTPDTVDVLWFPKASHAELVSSTCMADLEHAGAVVAARAIDLAPAALAAFVRFTAHELGAAWKTDEEVRQSASFEVERIIMQVDIGRRTGMLAEINAAYRAKRLEAQSAGRKVSSYPVHLAEFTRNLVVLAAKNIVCS